MSRLFTANWDLTAVKQTERERVNWVLSRGSSVALHSLSASRTWKKLPSAPIKNKREKKKKESTASMPFPSQWTHLALPTDHPIGLSKITFWVDYTLSTASPNYSPELRWAASGRGSSPASRSAACERRVKSAFPPRSSPKTFSRLRSITSPSESSNAQKIGNAATGVRELIRTSSSRRVLHWWRGPMILLRTWGGSCSLRNRNAAASWIHTSLDGSISQKWRLGVVCVQATSQFYSYCRLYIQARI